MKTKRIIALTLFLAALTSCGESGVPETTTDGGGTTAGVETTSNELPARNFDGKELRVVTSPDYRYQIYADEATGDVASDAVYDRNLRLEEKYGFRIVSLVEDSVNKYNFYQPIVKLVLAGDDVYDLVGHFAYSSNQAISNRIYRNWIDIPNLDLGGEWWNQTINDSLTINNKLYTLTGALSLSAMQSAYGMFWNVKLAADYGLDSASLYKTVMDGRWTIDCFANLVKEMYVDLDSDGKQTIEDRYGLTCMMDSTPDFWVFAFDQKLTSRTKDGIKIEVNTEKTASILEKLLTLYYGNEGVKNFEKTNTTVSHYGDVIFSEGHSVFATSTLMSAFDLYRSMKDEYGILPMPKWDEKQEEYHTLIRDQYTVWGIPVTAKDDDFIGFVTEALCRETYEKVYPVYYDIALKQKYSADEKTAEMVDILVGGASFDIAFVFGDWCGSVNTLIRTHVNNNDPNLASDLASRVYRLDELYALFKEN